MNNNKPNTQTVTFNIPNISCNHCVHTINMELSELEGVVSVSADLDTKQQFKLNLLLPPHYNP